jgi:hypothetical protein
MTKKTLTKKSRSSKRSVKKSKLDIIKRNPITTGVIGLTGLSIKY